jgi:hypothetical protein
MAAMINNAPSKRGIWFLRVDPVTIDPQVARPPHGRVRLVHLDPRNGPQRDECGKIANRDAATKYGYDLEPAHCQLLLPWVHHKPKAVAEQGTRHGISHVRDADIEISEGPEPPAA